MIVKVHNMQGRKLLAVCDSDLLGKKFEEGNKQLDLASDFYKGEEMKEEDLLEELKEPCSVNIVGEKSINFFLDKNLVDKEKIIRIDNIPHAELVVTEN